MSSYVKSIESTEEVFWIYDAAGVITELQIARIYNKNALLWEYANSNFFSADKKIIVSADKYVFNGKKHIN